MDHTATDGAGKPAQSTEQTSAAKSSDSAAAVPRAGAGEDGRSQPEWASHPVNIRLTIPLPFRSYYLTIVVGPERRSAERRAGERKKQPLLTIGNVIGYLVAGSICGLAALGLIELLFAYALNSGSLVAGSLAGLLLVAGIIACLWLLVRRLFEVARKAEL